MSPRRGAVIGWVACLAVAQGTALAEATIELKGVPERLSLPLAGGENLVLTATVKGAKPKGVWLAADKDAKGRLLLTAVGEGQWQVNLADPLVAGVLGGPKQDGQFQVYAELPDGQIVASVPVRYAARTTRKTYRPPRFYVVCGDERQAVRARHRGKHWFEPEAVSLVEVQFDPRFPNPSAEAAAGERSWPFTATKTKGLLDLRLTAAVRKHWQEAGSLVVRTNEPGLASGPLTLHAPPARLGLEGEPVKMTIIQRESGEVPGSGGYLRVEIGDITAGRTLLTLRTATDAHPIDKQPMSEGDEVPFALAAAHYRLRVLRLVNLLIGDDYGEFSVSPLPEDERQKLAAERKQIERLIEALEKANVKFVRDEVELPASEGAARLRKLLELAGPKLLTCDDFIDKLAAKSDLTGKDHLIKHPDGKTVKLADWLRQQAAEPKP